MIFSREIPPTAGLPARLSDFLPLIPRNAKAQLVQMLARQFSLPPLQLECSGTAGLIIALKTLQAMRQNKGRNEVIIPAYNCPLVALAIAHCGLKPRLCDTAKDSFSFDPAAFAALPGDKTLAAVPAHLGGQAADLSWAAQAKAAGAYIIEDAAQALGTPPAAGIGAAGDIIFYSLAAGKGLTLYEGGLLTAKTAAMREALAETSAHIIPVRPLFEARRLAEFFGYACFYRPHGLNLVYGMPRRRALAKGEPEQAVGDIFSADIPLHQVSNLRAACGLKAAARLPAFLQAAQIQAQQRLPQLAAAVAANGGKLIGAALEPAKAVWPFFMILMPSRAARDKALARLWAGPEGVSRLFIHALGDYAYLKPALGQQPSTPHARDFAARMLTISNSLWLDNRCFEKLCHILKQTSAGDGG